MLTLDIATVVVLLLIMGVACAVGGYAIAQARQRQAGDGKLAAELKSELSEYKENVAAHFQTTASLLHDMTEQYRSVYEHMASGAQNLCDAEQATAQIESLKAGLLPVLDPPSEPVDVIESSTEQSVEEFTSGTDASSQDAENSIELDQGEEHPSSDQPAEHDANPLEDRHDEREARSTTGPGRRR
ncbi:MAG: DUF1043 family protein [Proteobacteria bacterium]|nr:DUF1043 family protein [Pseudomonadota bacterium]